jgi:hypothetical protein
VSEKIDIVRRLRLEANGLGEYQAYASREYHRLLLDASDEIEKVREERDEARREVCVWQGLDTGKTSRDTAKIRGWDCYKENDK